MHSLRRFLALSGADRILLANGWMVLVLVRVLLWLAPLRTVSRLLSVMEGLPPRPRYKVSTEQVATAIDMGARYVPRASCLARALAGQVMLRRRSHSARIRIGFAPSEGTWAGHAWLESEGRVVLGGSVDLAQYQRLQALEARHNTAGRAEGPP